MYKRQVLHQAAHGVAHKAQHVHEHSGSRIQALLRRAAHKLHGSGRGHSGCNAHLCLAAAHGSGYGCIAQDVYKRQGKGRAARKG